MTIKAIWFEHGPQSSLVVACLLGRGGKYRGQLLVPDLHVWDAWRNWREKLFILNAKTQQKPQEIIPKQLSNQ